MCVISLLCSQFSKRKRKKSTKKIRYRFIWLNLFVLTEQWMNASIQSIIIIISRHILEKKSCNNNVIIDWISEKDSIDIIFSQTAKKTNNSIFNFVRLRRRKWHKRGREVEIILNFFFLAAHFILPAPFNMLRSVFQCWIYMCIVIVTYSELYFDCYCHISISIELV